MEPTTYDIVFGFWDATFSAFLKYYYWVVILGAYYYLIVKTKYRNNE